MNVKDRALIALKLRRDNQNFWMLMQHWHNSKMLPSAETAPNDRFSVLVYGPPKTWKTRIVRRLNALWPLARIRERPRQYVALRDTAGMTSSFEHSFWFMSTLTVFRRIASAARS